MDNKKRDYSDIIDMEPPAIKIPLARKERAGQFLAFEAVVSGKKLMENAIEIWLREYAPEDYREEVFKKTGGK